MIKKKSKNKITNLKSARRQLVVVRNNNLTKIKSKKGYWHCENSCFYYESSGCYGARFFYCICGFEIKHVK